MVKNSPANVGDTEMWVGSLGQDGPLEKDVSVFDHFDYVALHYMLFYTHTILHISVSIHPSNHPYILSSHYVPDVF